MPSFLEAPRSPVQICADLRKLARSQETVRQYQTADRTWNLYDRACKQLAATDAANFKVRL